MSLVAGPGVGGSLTTSETLPEDLSLALEKHVKYIQTLDTVRSCEWTVAAYIDILPAKR